MSTVVPARPEGERLAALEASYQHLATKADIEAIRSELKTLKQIMTWGLAFVAILATLISPIIGIVATLLIQSAG